MILEIRHYTLKEGCRESFITFFEATNRPALRAAGMLIFGPLRDLEDPDIVHWIRAFETLENRETVKDGFYDGPVWRDQIEPQAMSMIASYTAELAETTQGFEGFAGTADL